MPTTPSIAGTGRRVAHLRRAMILAALVVGLAACAPSTGTDGRRSEGEGRRGPSGSGTATVPEAAPTTLDYVALGDSLAAGVGADRGYVERYADHIASDTGVRVRTTNLGVSGQTSSELLDLLETSPGARRALGGAEVVTFNIGLNDLGRAAQEYEDGTCGGVDGEGCLRDAVESLKQNWDAIVAELADLGVTRDAVVRTPGLGYVPRAEANLRAYVDEVNRHIAATDDGSLRHTEVTLRERGMSQDGLHPNGTGYATIAEKLRGPGYGVLDGSPAAE